LPSLYDLLKLYKYPVAQIETRSRCLARARDDLALLEGDRGVRAQFIVEFIPNIFECVFGATLGMISGDFKSFPDHRVNFFVFLKTVVSKTFEALLNVPC
jgi:hypothetical protein